MLGEIVALHPVVLVDFYADWCEPCKWLDPILKELPGRMNGEIFILKINIDQHAVLSASLDIKSVPVLMLYVKGEPVWRLNGFLNAPELAEKIKTFL